MYCEECNKKLEDGVCTNCKPQKSSFSIQYLVKRFWSLLVGMIKKPVDTMRSFISKQDVNFSLIVLTTESLVIALLVTALYFTRATSFYVGSYFFFSLRIFSFFVKYIFIFYFVELFIICVLFVIIHTLFKVETKLEKIVCLVSVSTLILLPTICLSFFAHFISLPLTILILLLGFLLSILHMYEGISFVGKVDKNHKAYIAIILTFCFYFVFFFLFPFLLG